MDLYEYMGHAPQPDAGTEAVLSHCTINAGAGVKYKRQDSDAVACCLGSEEHVC